jgi:hypothetical protein
LPAVCKKPLSYLGLKYTIVIAGDSTAFSLIVFLHFFAGVNNILHESRKEHLLRTIVTFNCKANFRMFNLIFYYCQIYFNLSVSHGWGKSQLRRQGSKAKGQHGRDLDNLQKQVRRFYIYQKLKVPYF